MSVMDKLKEKLRAHPQQAEKAVQKGGDMIDKKTGGKYRGQVDSAQQKAQEQFRERDDQDPGS